MRGWPCAKKGGSRRPAHGGKNRRRGLRARVRRIAPSAHAYAGRSRRHVSRMTRARRSPHDGAIGGTLIDAMISEAMPDTARPVARADPPVEGDEEHDKPASGALAHDTPTSRHIRASASARG